MNPKSSPVDPIGHIWHSNYILPLSLFPKGARIALTKADLIETIQSNNGLTQQQSADIVEATIGIIKDTLVSGEDVLISGWVISGIKMVKDKCSSTENWGVKRRR